MRHAAFVRPLSALMSLAACITAASVSAPLAAQIMMFDSAQPISPQEETARFLPGVFYFQKGLDYYKKGQMSSAIEAWQTAAGWAMKDAQYNLGLAYFKGNGIAADRPRGLAWLALAAERKNPALQVSLATAWDSASDAEHQQANAIWRELKQQYGDDVALARARKRFDTALAQISGARAGSGNARVMSRSMGAMDVAAYRERLTALAEQNFGAISGSADTASTEASKQEDAR
jgi:TPR repeat protein